jgi:aspartyl-tRNA(Asn)/glutamyl-tRNA(Gln) amidotransferase subunit B
MKYIPTMDLRVHMELNTDTKMFCRCPNVSEEKSRTKMSARSVSVIRTMPVANIDAIKAILRLGTALSGEITCLSQFDRKSYFYPDITEGLSDIAIRAPVR